MSKTYGKANWLILLSHSNLTQTLSSYAYTLDKVGNRVQVTETLSVPLPGDTFLESGGLVAMEAEHFSQNITGTHQAWITNTAWSGYTGTAYLQATPDLGALYAADELTSSPELQYQIRFVTAGAYTLWLYGAAPDAGGDSIHVSLGDQVVGVSGFAPRQWSWASSGLTNGEAVTLTVGTPGLYTLHVWAREDGVRLDRILLTTDGNYVPTGHGPAESARSDEGDGGSWEPVTTAIAYDYDPLYRLMSATYSSSKVYTYTYDQVGNRLKMGDNGNVKEYAYDAGNRLTSVDGVGYTWDDNGNLLDDGVRNYIYDAANRLVQVVSGTLTTTFSYNGDGHRMTKTENGETTTYAVAVLGLSQVLMETTAGESVLYLYGHDLLAEEGSSGWAYHLGDGLGSVRQLANSGGDVSLAQGYTPFGVPLWSEGSSATGYGFTGERWEAYSQLLFLRARYYEPGTGRFLNKDPLGGSVTRPTMLNGFIYVNNNPVRFIDLVGLCGADPFDPYYDYECWILAKRVADLTGEPLEDVGKASYYWLLHAYEGLKNEPSYDPLTSRQRMFAIKNARLFEIPVELVAGTIATEIVDDTQWHDPLLDAFLEMGLAAVAQETDAEWEFSYSEKPIYFWTEFLGGYEHYWGLLGGRGPGPGVANVHVSTAKAAEDYFAAYYPEQRLLPHHDVYARLDLLLRDESNIRYTAAILKQLADLRKGSCGEPKLGSHRHDLTLVDMQIIYGAFRAGWESYDGTKEGYQQWKVPGKYGKQIYHWLLFYGE